LYTLSELLLLYSFIVYENLLDPYILYFDT